MHISEKHLVTDALVGLTLSARVCCRRDIVLSA